MEPALNRTVVFSQQAFNIRLRARLLRWRLRGRLSLQVTDLLHRLLQGAHLGLNRLQRFLKPPLDQMFVPATS